MALGARLRQRGGLAQPAAMAQRRAEAVRGAARLRARPARRIVGACGGAVGERRGLAERGRRGGRVAQSRSRRVRVVAHA